jgi:hypothetical protein
LKYLATTCLFSEISKPLQRLHFAEFVSKNVFALAPETLLDIQRGIVRIIRTNPKKAAELRQWLSDIRDQWPILAGREHEKARVLAAMLECKDLKAFWLPQPKAKYPSFGYHVGIAATAIVHELPIAGFGVDPYLEIGRYFQLPGLFDLKVQSWRSELEAYGQTHTSGRPMRIDPMSSAISKRWAA